MTFGVSERTRVFGIIALVSLPLLLLAAVNLWQSVGEAQDRVSTERVALARAGADRRSIHQRRSQELAPCRPGDFRPVQTER